MSQKLFKMYGVSGAVVGLLLTFLFIQPVFAASEFSADLELSSGQYLSISDANQTGLDITGDMTVEAWVKFESDGADYQVIASKYESVGSQMGWQWRWNPDSGVTFCASSNGSSVTCPTDVSSALSTDIWYHLAVVYTASLGKAEFFVDGSSIGSQSGLPTSIYDNTAAFRVGLGNPGGNEYVDGLIGELRVWNDVRSQSEIENNMFELLTGSESNLVGLWSLNGTTTDATSNSNDLTNNGSATFSSQFPYNITCTVPSSTLTGLNFSLNFSCVLNDVLF